jgi:hypothetical protein
MARGQAKGAGARPAVFARRARAGKVAMAITAKLGVDVMRYKAMAAVLPVVPVLALATPAAADPSLSARIDTGLRYYLEDGQYPGQGSAGAYPYLGFEIAASTPFGPGDLVFEVNTIVDQALDRTLVNLEKAFYTQRFDGWDIVLGYNVEDWGVSAGRTIVNVLNARDRTGRIGGGSLIGTPMLNANVVTDVGTFSAYALFGDVREHFGGDATRQRAFLPVDSDFAAYEDDDSVDVALRYSHDFAVGAGSLDIGAHVYHGTSREGVALPGCVATTGVVTEAICAQINTAIIDGFAAGGTQPLTPAEMTAFVNGLLGPVVAADYSANAAGLIPYYQEINQVGLTAVYANGNTQLRFEGFWRETAHEDYVAAIIGGDRTFYDVAGLNGDLVVALEYHYDDRSARQNGAIFDDDVFLGLSYLGNDAAGTEASFGMFQDLDTSAQFFTLGVSRRIGDRFRISLDATHIEAGGTGDPLAVIDNDSFVELTLSTFF